MSFPSGPIRATFGLHPIDVNLAMGDLLRLLHDEAEVHASALNPRPG